jgi:lipopolysaccharide export LptBFGC system permease protein LptF
MTPGDAILITAAAAVWDSAIGDWRLEDGRMDNAAGGKPCAILGAPEWTPEKVRERGQDNVDCELLSYDELLETRQLRPNRRDVAMALHRHIAYPLANVILLLLALPFAIHFERGSRIERVLGAIGICGAYLLFDLTCQNLGQNGWVQPAVAAWSPTILFGSLGLVMYASIRS